MTNDIAGEIVARARALIGVRFRPQGRSAELGLDCIGVAAMAMNLPDEQVPRHYNLRCPDPEHVNRDFAECGFLRIVRDRARDGDLLLVQAAFAQLHVVILTRGGYLHADARLRRVAEVPGPVPWPVLSAWRHPDAGPPEEMRATLSAKRKAR